MSQNNLYSYPESTPSPSSDEPLVEGDGACPECNGLLEHKPDCALAYESDYLRQAHDILSGKGLGIRMVQREHLEALRDHFTGTVEETRAALECALEHMRQGTYSWTEQILKASIDSLKAWAERPTT